MSGVIESARPGGRTTTQGPERIPATKSVIWSAWAIPVLIVGEFAMLAVVPVVVLTVAVFRDVLLRALRWWAAAAAAAYASGLAAWAIGPDRAPSLSKDLHPVHAAAIVVVVIAFALRYLIARRAHP